MLTLAYIRGRADASLCNPHASSDPGYRAGFISGLITSSLQDLDHERRATNGREERASGYSRPQVS